jgi:hypothetical protein
LVDTGDATEVANRRAEPDKELAATVCAESAGRMWVVPRPGFPGFDLVWAYGQGLGPGLTCESADAVRVVLRIDLSAESICAAASHCSESPSAR